MAELLLGALPEFLAKKTFVTYGLPWGFDASAEKSMVLLRVKGVLADIFLWQSGEWEMAKNLWDALVSSADEAREALARYVLPLQ